MQAKLDALAEEAFRKSLAADPFEATLLGFRDFDHEVPDLSEAFEERRREELDAILRQAANIEAQELHGEDRVTHGTLLFETRSQRHALDSRLIELAISPTIGGTHVQVLQLVPKVTLVEPSQAAAYLERCAKLDGLLEQAADRHRQGAARGRTPPARAVIGAIGQIDRYLATPIARDPLLSPQPPSGWDAADSWREELAAVLEGIVRPAMGRYRDRVRDEVLPHARPDERSGVSWLPDGVEVYTQAIERHTTTALGAEEIHQLGLDLIAALGDEYRHIGRNVLGTTDLATIFARLRQDPALRFERREQVRRAAEEALGRADAAAATWFGQLPSVGCIVREIPDVEAREGTIAYYFPPAQDGSRPGIYWINTYQPETRTRFECEALAFHESVPGHHLQCALAQELDLPPFRRFSFVNAYVEGWGLYAERLADEMGLYTSDLTRLGMLSMDSLRAGRLVVDTGLHAKGWSRQQAVDFLRSNSPQALNNIDNEVDRYIAWPGQALGYMIGRLELRRLRDEARMRLGDRFDVRTFHDVVLGHGAVPLGVLGEVVDDWIASHA
ncbi:MAG: DUF885 domain-containing protein [Actinomycetota bacterium]|nr:DUF885 domain-containing protein [Actinomycetota bacterium]